MRFALTKDHLDFFYRNHFIELEDLLSMREVKTLDDAIEDVLDKRMGEGVRTPKKVYLAGHDCWKDDPRIKKVVLNPLLAEIASQLTKKRTVRLAFDQILCGSPSSEKVFEKPLHLQDLSSIQKVTCGLILHLFSDEELEDPLPKKPGSATFFSLRHPLSFDYLSKASHLTQLLIVYAIDNALYTHNPTDPHTHALKKLHYGFGDHVRPDTHPIILKP